MNQHHKCSVCGRNDVRLYRWYGSFLRDDEIQCKAHMEGKNAAIRRWQGREWKMPEWRVPLIEDHHDGAVWGYTSCPDDDIARWDGLPEGTWMTTVPWGRLVFVVGILAAVLGVVWRLA